MPRHPAPEQIDVPGYRGPERRSGKHSPYGDGLFRLMRSVEAEQARIAASLAALAPNRKEQTNG